MIDVRDIQGNIVKSVPITQACQKIEELMVSDYIQLSWNSDSNEELQAGCYIEYNGEKFSLLEPYKPTQKNEVEFTYTPQFKSKVMAWSKVPFFFYTTNEDKTTKEPDWTLTSNPADFMKCVCDALKNETGDDWTYTIDASLPASASLSFNTVDIFSSLNEIARVFETEWYADKVNNILYLGKASFGESVTLEVGDNIKVPSVNNTREGYYTRFYAFGSTRNITQDYEGSNVNNLVNKRLTLDPVKYPNGYKDIRADLRDGEIFSKVLVFDDVYPSSKLSISSVRNRLMYRVDGSGNKIQIGTDENGNPIYDQYAIWYFRINGFEFDTKNIIQGQTLSVHFQTGALAGREFELKYYESKQTITTSDGLKFDVQKGDYEILFVEEGNYIIPSLVGLVPSEGDEVILFNIEMPSEYTQSAYDELEAELDKEIERLTSNLNNYSFNSNPVAFSENNPNLTIGRNVTYKNGDETLNTRVIKLTTQLDFPIEQNITIGNEKIKGNTQQLKEEVATANKDLNLLAVFNNMTTSLQQSYNRTQQMMLDGFAAIKNIWQLREDDNGNKYIYSAFNVATEGGVSMYRNLGFSNIPSIYDGLPIDRDTIYWENGVLKAKGGGGTGGVDESAVRTLIESYDYATKDFVRDYVLQNATGGEFELSKQMVIDALGFTPYSAENPNGYITAASIPSALKNPYALTFGSKTYDGSVAKSITASDLGAALSSDLSKYLPLTGGTIQVDNVGKFNIYNTAQDGSYVHFFATINSTKTDLGYIGINKDKVPTFITLGGVSNTIWHAGNFNPANYLPLSGGTLTGNLMLKSTSQSSDSPKLYFQRGTTTDSYYDNYIYNKGGGIVFGYSSNGTDYDLIQIGSTFLRPVTDNVINLGTSSLRWANGYFSNLYVNDNAVWHSGNDGSGSGLDADTLDGVHLMGKGGNSGVMRAWSRHEGYTTSKQYFGNGNVVVMDPKPTDDSNLWANTTIFSLGDMEIRSHQLAFGYGTDVILYRRVYDGPTYNSWKTIAFTTSNVASATKLQTERTLWGQSFDGTENVTGKIIMPNNNSYAVNNADGTNYSAMYMSPSNILQIGYGTAGKGYDTIINGNTVKLTYGTSRTNALFINSSGNVGIGTTNPTYKLDVNGDLQIKAGNYIANRATLILNSNSGHAGDIIFKSGSTTKGNYGWWAISSRNDSTGVLAIYRGSENGANPTESRVITIDPSGNILATGGVTMQSQRSLKNVVDERGLSLTELSDIKPTRYTWIDKRDDRLHFGGIADDIEKVLPEVIYKTADGTLTMDYGNAGFAVATSLIKPVVDHEKRIIDHDERIKALERENKELKERLNRYEA